MLEYLLITIALIICVIGSITDLRIREVPDWLNLTGILIGIFVHAIGSVMTLNGWFFLESIFGLGIAFLIGSLMYYGGQWGGGDTKLLTAVGALLGFSININNLFVSVLIFSVVIGAFYGLIWSFVLAIKHWKQFSHSFNNLMKAPLMLLLQKILLASLFMGVIVTSFLEEYMLKIITASFLIGIPIFIWLFFCIKAVELSCMIKSVSPFIVTEGDWIAKEVVVDGKRICGPKDLGITKEQLGLLQKFARQKKIRNVIIKIGIPFVPTFLFALIAALLFNNPLLLLL